MKGIILGKFISLTVVLMPKLASKFAYILFVIGMLVLMGFFLRLGFWQYQRAAEKERILETAAHARRVAISPLQTLPIATQSAKTFRWIELRGEYEPYTVLLDNQQRDHQVGFNVLTPFRLANSSERILVDRGFIVRDMHKDDYPTVPAPKGLQTIQGYLYLPSGQQWVLGEVLQYQDKRKMVVERLDLLMVGSVLRQVLYPAVLRLSPAMPHGFRRDWPLVNMLPERHKAYAVQWFAFAALTLLICVAMLIRRKRGGDV